MWVRRSAMFRKHPGDSDMDLKAQRERFEESARIHERAKLTFKGVDGFDVYNPSIPFDWNGRRYIFGRVERRAEWARSWVRLFAAVKSWRKVDTH